MHNDDVKVKFSVDARKSVDLYLNSLHLSVPPFMLILTATKILKM